MGRVNNNKIIYNIQTYSRGFNKFGKCQSHQQPAHSICLDCCCELCDTCISNHSKNHSIMNKSEFSEEDIKSILASKNTANTRNNNIGDKMSNYIKVLKNTLIQKIENKIDELSNKRNEQLKFIDNYKDLLRAKYENLINSLLNIKAIMSFQVQELERINNDVSCYLVAFQDSPNNSDLNKNINDLVNKYKSIKKEIHLNSNLLYAGVNDILGFGKFTVTIHNYVKKVIERKPKNKIYELSNYHIGFNTWRCRIYPWGSGDAEGAYISAFLGLEKNPKALEKEIGYNYKIEIVNHSGRPNHVSNFDNRFTTDDNQVFGLFKLYKIENLEKEGFLDNNGSLTINFYVRPDGHENFEKELEEFRSNN